MTALNVKTNSSLATKISLAIIINFIYYRHSFLNVCLPLFRPDASHPVFFTLLYTSFIFLCYRSKIITIVNYFVKNDNNYRQNLSALFS
ncbi:hypothetical protein CRG94_10275 [Escherichia sp. E3356]|nr:hypothetical protein CRT22_04215 [Escherichia sp. E5028]TGB67526.1 hypothetical protein CQB02_05215 [Escherichia coli]TGB74449.1 hypothetical protein CRI66_23275 [Escherichia sp. E4694]TGB94039.1 hypothetical protein CRG94_10275 [Escherichia sp. E3356]TGC02429.1 hypothetical protein CRG92_05715 [Escherichia sp. E2586]TGC07275.1 hypothetical protein CRG93_17075 [Escherichia sp. E2593]TGC17230.1 hypothetical protein CQJ28_11905 [Escherichia sp. E2562]